MSTPCSGKVKLPLVLKPTLTRLLMRRKMVSARPVESISGWTVSNFVTRDLDSRGFVQAGHAQERHTRASWYRLTTSHLEDGLTGIATTSVARVGARHGINGRLSTTIAIGAQARALDGERVGIVGDDAGAQEVGRHLGAIELA